MLAGRHGELVQLLTYAVGAVATHVVLLRTESRQDAVVRRRGHQPPGVAEISPRGGVACAEHHNYILASGRRSPGNEQRTNFIKIFYTEL